MKQNLILGWSTLAFSAALFIAPATAGSRTQLQDQPFPSPDHHTVMVRAWVDPGGQVAPPLNLLSTYVVETGKPVMTRSVSKVNLMFAPVRLDDTQAGYPSSRRFTHSSSRLCLLEVCGYAGCGSESVSA